MLVDKILMLVVLRPEDSFGLPSKQNINSIWDTENLQAAKMHAGNVLCNDKRVCNYMTPLEAASNSCLLTLASTTTIDFEITRELQRNYLVMEPNYRTNKNLRILSLFVHWLNAKQDVSHTAVLVSLLPY